MDEPEAKKKAEGKREKKKGKNKAKAVKTLKGLAWYTLKNLKNSLWDRSVIRMCTQTSAFTE